MKTIALLSGGKDSILAMFMAMRYGHNPVVIANMTPAPDASGMGAEEVHEVDSYMFQTVGHEVVGAIAQCLQLPLRRSSVARGQAKDQSLLYTTTPSPDDEVEELYRLLRALQEEFPEVRGVTSGAILSNYQRNRVECVCGRLKLVSLAYLWQRKGCEVLDMAAALRVEAILVKTASVGLCPSSVLGKTLQEARPTLEKMETLYGSHLAGEGGEFETVVLDCPIYKEQRLRVREQRLVVVDANEYAPSGHLVLSVELVAKTAQEKRASADTRRKLLNGGFWFSSDRMAALAPWGGACVQPPVLAVVTRSLATVSSSDTDPFWGTELFQFVVVSSPMASRAAADVARALQEELFRAVWARLGAEDEVVHCVVHLPDMPLLEEAFRAAYEAAVPAVRPPCLTLLGTSDTTASPRLRMEVLAAHTPIRDRSNDVLQVQSRSCWAAGCVGPYSAARRVRGADGHSRVMTGAVMGLVPHSWELATASDMLDEEGLRPVTADGVSADFMAQFAYAVANASAYGSFFGSHLIDCTHVTLYCVEDDLGSGGAAAARSQALPALWEWCTHRKWGGGSLQGRIVMVAALPRKSAVQVVMEWREQ